MASSQIIASSIIEEDDVFSSAPYATVINDNGSPSTHIQMYHSPNTQPSRGNLTPLHRKRLIKSNKRLRQYNCHLTLALTILVVVLLVSILVIDRCFPRVWAEVFLEAEASATPSPVSSHPWAAFYISPETQGWCESIRQRCGLSPRSGGCSSVDVETALCLLTKAKSDLDARTTRLDAEVYRNNRQLESLIPSPDSLSTISGVYSRRPSFHLHLYYSHEYLQKPEANLQPLLWTEGQSGLSSLREVDAIKDGDAIAHIRVLHPGYYHVYSQVTVTSSAALNWQGNQPLHCLYKNHGDPQKHPNTYRSMVKSFKTLSSSGISYLQGVFLLKAGDVLTILSHPSILNTTAREGTFLGAFRI